MSDWEYWAEHNEPEARFADDDPDRRSLLCTLDDEGEDEVWSWHPGHRVLGWLTYIHDELHIGANLFFASAMYEATEGEGQDSPTAHGDQRHIGGVTYRLVHHEKEARYDVISIARADGGRLSDAARQLKAAATTLKETYFAEMMAAMAAFIHEHATVESFVFAREI